jgi:hypothetical protein
MANWSLVQARQKAIEITCDGDCGHIDDGLQKASLPDRRIVARPWPGSAASGNYE